MPIIVFFITLNPFYLFFWYQTLVPRSGGTSSDPLSGIRIDFSVQCCAPRAEPASKAIIQLRSSGMTESATVWNPYASDACFMGFRAQDLNAARNAATLNTLHPGRGASILRRLRFAPGQRMPLHVTLPRFMAGHLKGGANGKAHP
jgi:hypothetical protein